MTQQLNRQLNQQQSTRYLNGASDAAMGNSPTSKATDYLDGYFTRLRLLVEESHTLSIRWLSSAYQSGGYDSQPYDYSNDPF